MSHAIFKKIIAVSFCAIFLSACGSSKEETGSLVQRYTMHDAKGVNFGVVELDPVNGGTIVDAQGRPFARVIPYQPAQVAAVQ